MAAGPLIHAADDCMELSEEMSTASSDYDSLGLALEGTLSFDERKSVEESAIAIFLEGSGGATYYPYPGAPLPL